MTTSQLLRAVLRTARRMPDSRLLDLCAYGDYLAGQLRDYELGDQAIE